MRLVCDNICFHYTSRTFARERIADEGVGTRLVIRQRLDCRMRSLEGHNSLSRTHSAHAYWRCIRYIPQRPALLCHPVVTGCVPMTHLRRLRRLLPALPNGVDNSQHFFGPHRLHISSSAHYAVSPSFVLHWLSLFFTAIYPGVAPSLALLMARPFLKPMNRP